MRGVRNHNTLVNIVGKNIQALSHLLTVHVQKARIRSISRHCRLQKKAIAWDALDKELTHKDNTNIATLIVDEI
jgi:hypothetical protein